MTLIVLEIRVPAHVVVHGEQDLLNALADLGPRMLTYLMSFMTLGIFWVGQQTQLTMFKTADRDLTWINLAFLAAVAVMPFSTSLLAEYITLRTALLIYWANIFALGAILYGALAHGCHVQNLRSDEGEVIARALQRRILVAQGLYAVGAMLCVVSTYWSIGFIILVQLYYAVAPRLGWFRRRGEASTA
jgi:uncharacterized membrane protein